LLFEPNRLRIVDVPAPDDDLITHVARSTGLSPAVATRVVSDVVAFYSETVESLVRRRHRELQAEGLTNDAIFDRIVAELVARPVAAPDLTPRQLRRIVYG
jgi:hypothetical protein